MVGLEDRTGSVRRRVDQCMMGGRTRKSTCLSGTLVGLEGDDILCDGRRTHDASRGRDASGNFVSARLATYPEGLNEFIALRIVASLKHMALTGSGPTGWRRGTALTPKISNWTTYSEAGQPGIAFLNEEAVRGVGVCLTPSQSALYMHVDDGVVMTSGADGASEAGDRCNTIMEFAADALEDSGFVVNDRTRWQDLNKIIGYEVENSPARLRAPINKAVMLRSALRFLASGISINTKALRAVLGIWIWCALLNRNMLSIPHAVFKLIDKHPDTVVRLWDSARRELVAMAAAVAFQYADVGAPFAPVVFATDAQGADDSSATDFGGYGIVVRDADASLLRDCFTKGVRPGRTVAKLEKAFVGSRFPERAIERNVPFTQLPPRLFEAEEWHPIEGGRWKWAEHITLGESRAVVRMLSLIAGDVAWHRKKLFSLQDNMPCSCSFTKGRSPAFALNTLIRKKAALCMGTEIALLLPWVQTTLQVADGLSREGAAATGAAARR